MTAVSAMGMSAAEEEIAHTYTKERKCKFVAVTKSMYDKDAYYAKLNAQTNDKPADLDKPLYLPNTLTVVGSKQGVKVYVGDKEIDCKGAAPFIDENGRTQIPIRAVSEALNASVNWNEETKTVTIRKGAIEMQLEIGSSIMKAGNESVTMDTAARIVDDRTFIPLRYVGGGLNVRVEWVEE